MGIVNKLFKKDNTTVELATKLEQEGKSRLEQEGESIDMATIDILPPPDPYIYGYKGMKQNMTAHDGFQYVIGETYRTFGEVKLCENGFHFCEYLRYVGDYYSFYGTGNRFFKIKALRETVKSSRDNGNFFDFSAPKFAAGEITILEEVSDKELYDIMDVSDIPFDMFVKYRFENKSIEELRNMIMLEEIDELHKELIKEFNEIYVLTIVDRLKKFNYYTNKKMIKGIKDYLVIPTSLELKVFFIEMLFRDATIGEKM